MLCPKESNVPALGLFGTFNTLPSDVINAHLWSRLSDRVQKNLALTSRAGRELVSMCVTSVRLTYGNNEVGNPEEEAARASKNEVGAPYFTQAQLDAWKKEIALRCAFLARLPLLEEIGLSESLHDAALVSELRLYGASTQGRVTRLVLSGSLSSFASDAIAFAFPSLKSLDLDCDFNYFGQGTNTCRLASDFLLPLKDCPLESVRILYMQCGDRLLQPVLLLLCKLVQALLLRLDTSCNERHSHGLSSLTVPMDVCSFGLFLAHSSK